jgi:hypothetical protein
MKDLALLILNQIPKYFSDFIKCLAGPKGFVRARSDDSQQALAEAMTFLGISFAFSMLLFWPLMPAQVESTRFLVGRGLLYLILVAAGTAVTLVSWRCVGGRAPFGRFFVISCYYVGVVIVCQTLILLCAYGVVKIFDLELYPVLVDSTTRLQFGDTRLTGMINGAGGRRHVIVLLIFYFIMLVVDPIAVTIWSVLGWGAYREINGLSKGRSFAAGVIASLLTFLIIPFLLLLQYVTE